MQMSPISPVPHKTETAQSMNTKTTTHQVDLLAVKMIELQEQSIRDWITVYNSFLGLDKGKVVIDSLHPSAEKGVAISLLSDMKIWGKPTPHHPEGLHVDFDVSQSESLLKRLQEQDPGRKHGKADTSF